MAGRWKLGIVGVLVGGLLVVGAARAEAADADGDGVANRRDRCPQLRGTRPDGCPTGKWRLRNSNTFGPPDVSFEFGSYAWTPIAGDWDGDGSDTAGAWDRANGRWRLFEFSEAVATFTFGPGDGPRTPLVGDWDGDGDDTVGIYDPSIGTFFLRNTNTTGAPDVVFTYGGNHTAAEVAARVGDWDGDGDDTIALHVRANGQWQLRNSNTSGAADILFFFGTEGGIPVAGDWDGNGTTTVGLANRGGNLVWRLRNSNSTGTPDLQFGFGASTGTPLVGDWDGDGDVSVGVRRT